MIKRFISLLLCVLLTATVFSSCKKQEKLDINIDKSLWKTNYSFVFVHGLSGWGSYDNQNKYLKYWGMFGGDLLEFLDAQGFNTYSASVDPQGSAWDRACELYAQLTGTVTDYGKEHSERCNHDRFGTDFTGKALIPSWSSDDKINLLGHSFGGATIRMLSTLMKDGSEAERKVTEKDDLSPLFAGGKEDWIYSITTLAAPHNGTTAYESDAIELEEKHFFRDMLSSMVEKVNTPETDGRILSDYADYDLRIDNAVKLNETLLTYDDIYYFSYPCSCTDKDENGVYVPDEKITESMFINSSTKMGMYMGVTDGGVEITSEWLDNDGLVNVISQRAPFNAESEPYKGNGVNRGIWYVMETQRGDHMSLQGDMFKTKDVREFYLKHLCLINSL